MRCWWLRLYGAELNGSSAAEYVREHGLQPELEEIMVGIFGKRETWGRLRSGQGRLQVER